MADITSYSPDYTGCCFSGGRQDADVDRVGGNVQAVAVRGDPLHAISPDQQLLGKAMLAFGRACS